MSDFTDNFLPFRRTNKDVYTHVYTALSRPAIDLQKIPILAKKKSSFQMKLILILIEAIAALKDNIREAIGEIQLPTIDNVLKNLIDHVGYCMASRGSHLKEIIFHY